MNDKQLTVMKQSVQEVMANEVQNRQTMIQKECPLVADMGTPAAGCDMTPALKAKVHTSLFTCM